MNVDVHPQPEVQTQPPEKPSKPAALDSSTSNENPQRIDVKRPNETTRTTEPSRDTATLMVQTSSSKSEKSTTSTVDKSDGDEHPSPLPDTTDPSSEEEEPPLKTGKTTKPGKTTEDGIGEQDSEQEPGKAVTAKASSQGKKAKKKKGRNPAVNVSGGKNRSPFMSLTYKCVSLNVNGIAERRKRELIFDFVKYFNADLVCLQEALNDSERIEKEWTKEWGGACIWSRATNRSRGVAIMLKPGLDLMFGNVRKDSNGRVIAATLLDSENNPCFNVMNVYTPTVPTERKDFFDELWRYKPGDQNLLLAGDFNCVVNT